VLEESSLVGQLHGALSRAVRLVGNLSLHVPVFALAVGVAAVRWLRARKLDFRDPATILLPCLAFLVAVPFVVPNPGARQMGPRYLLCVVPAAVLAGVMLLGQLRTTRARNLLLAGLGLSLAIGVVQNSLIQAPRMTREYEERILPALRFLRSRPSKLVLVNDSGLTQELQAELGPKEFVLAHRRPAVVRALEAARELGEPRPLLLSFEDHDDISVEVPPSIPVRSLGIHGGIRFFEVTLPPGWRPVPECCGLGVNVPVPARTLTGTREPSQFSDTPRPERAPGPLFVRALDCPSREDNDQFRVPSFQLQRTGRLSSPICRQWSGGYR
jgi:hypothetical protein